MGELNIIKEIPCVSVVVPCHNVEHWLERCVISLLKQTVRSLEVILVENGSIDRTLEICKNFAKTYDNIKVLSSEVADPSTARNLGVREAKGQFIAFIDADDWIDSDTFEVMLREMKLHGQEIGYFIYRYEWPDGRVSDQFEATGESVVQNVRELQREVIVNNRQLGACCMIFPRSFFERHRFPENKLMEDYATLYKWIGDYENVLCVKKAFYHYIQHPDGIMGSKKLASKRFADFVDAEIGRLKYLSESGIFDNPADEFRARDLILDHAIGHLKAYSKSGGVSRCFSKVYKNLCESIIIEVSKSGLENYSGNKLRHMAMMKKAWFVHALFLRYVWRRNEKYIRK